MRVRFYDIQWAIDEDQTLEECGLFTECTLDIDEELAKDYDTVDQFLEEEAATLLSDRFGFLVFGCKYEIVKQTVHITVEGGVIQPLRFWANASSRKRLAPSSEPTTRNSG